MTSKELKQALITLEWSNKTASDNLGITDLTIYNYMQGKRDIPLSIEKFIKLHLKIKRAVSILY